MKRTAFTLQEALITVGIIGIVAAITVPALTKLLPNPYQTRYLKAYDAITTLTKEMLSNPDLYWYNSDGQNCDGLACNTVPANGSVPDALWNLITNRGANNNPNWVQKYAAILAYNMQVPDDTMVLFDNDIPGPSFITANGIQFNFSAQDNDIRIDIDVDPLSPNNNPDKGNVIPDNSPLPHNHRFSVDINGNITPEDPLGMVYLDDPTRTNNKKDIIQLSNDKVNDAGISWFGPTVDNIDQILCEKGFKAYCSYLNYKATNAVVDPSETKGINN